MVDHKKTKCMIISELRPFGDFGISTISEFDVASIKTWRLAHNTFSDVESRFGLIFTEKKTSNR